MTLLIIHAARQGVCLISNQTPACAHRRGVAHHPSTLLIAIQNPVRCHPKTLLIAIPKHNHTDREPNQAMLAGTAKWRVAPNPISHVGGGLHTWLSKDLLLSLSPKHSDATALLTAFMLLLWAP